MPGGSLVFFFPVMPSPCPRPVWGLGPLEEAVRELEGEGTLSREDYLRLNNQSYPRSVPEVMAVLEDSQVAADWSVRHCTVRSLPQLLALAPIWPPCFAGPTSPPPAVHALPVMWTNLCLPAPTAGLTPLSN